MKIEPMIVAAGSSTADETQKATTVLVETTVEITFTRESMSYDDLLPYLFLPMAGAY